MEKRFNPGTTEFKDTPAVKIVFFNSVDKLSELQLPKFLDAVTAMPLIDTAVYGDWFGYGGMPQLNMENHKGYSSEHDIILNMG